MNGAFVASMWKFTAMVEWIVTPSLDAALASTCSFWIRVSKITTSSRNGILVWMPGSKTSGCSGSIAPKCFTMPTSPTPTCVNEPKATMIKNSAATTKDIVVGTGVTCPIIRMHPATIAHAVATSSVMLDGRFFLGVGTGENLNEHVIGGKWPPIEVRQEMLEESIELMRLLFQGGEQSFRGRYYTLEDARLYTIGDDPPPIYVAAGGPQAAELAGRIADGLISTNPGRELVNTYERAG